MTEKQKSKILNLVLPRWLYDELVIKAESMGINVSEAIREAIREFIKK
jgi:post-segregation antitoxin (ccd killing protein)